MKINRKLMPKDIKGKTIVIRKNIGQSIPATTKTRLTFQQVDEGYDNDVFELINNGIRLKSSLIKTISVTFNYQTASAVECVSYIDKNGEQVGALGRAPSNSGTMTCVFNATKDDVIYCAAWFQSSTTITSATSWNFATLTILDTN